MPPPTHKGERREPVARAPGALLSPRLATAAAHFAARLRAARALTAIRHLQANHAVQEVLVDFSAEQPLVERDGL